MSSIRRELRGTGRWRACLASLALLACLLPGRASYAAPDASGATQLTHRWLFAFQSLGTQEEVDSLIALFPKAQASGYNAVVLTDNTLCKTAPLSPEYLEGVNKIQAAAEMYGLELIPSVMPFGYSGGLLDENRNFAEGLPVTDALFVAKGGALECVPDPPVVVADGDFEAADLAAWAHQLEVDKSVFLDREVAHGGGGSLRMLHLPEETPQTEPGRRWPRRRPCGVGQIVQVRPFRQYHLTVWIRTKDFSRPSRARVLVGADFEGNGTVNYADLQFESTQDWTEHHLVFNSLDNDTLAVGLYLSRPGDGEIWWDDLKIEEIGLLNVLRRPGCPLSVRGEDGTVYEEGRDFAEVRDPLLDPYDIYHEQPTIRLTPDTRIEDGARLRVSYYHPILIHTDQVVGCLSEPGMFDVLRRQVEAVNERLHPRTFFMKHDEIRLANWCQACHSRGLTPGELLADNVRRCAQIIRDVNPEAKIWVWSDMFDPMHNAREGEYYLVNGSWEGSWEGLDPEIGIVNWAGFLRGRNLKWFSDRGHEQILSGYYDRDDDGRGIREWLAAAEGVAGVTGAMYTTWIPKYDSLEAWAAAAWGDADEGR
ncbi:MAG: hypothetical protein JXA57_19400 [Armatimonadetes bacterium]|nr:hypothetical protein [Armatimonadota bacterium]